MCLTESGLPMTADSEASAGAEERGKWIAAALMGGWRLSPPPLSLSPADLAEITPLLLGSGAAALGWWRVRHSKLQSCPAASQLKQGYRLHILQTAIHEPQIQKAFAVLRSAGVEPLLAKGWAAAQLYPEQGLRPYGDIDLYVRPEQHRAARIALSTGVPPGPVDLHRGFHELDDRSFEELYRRSRQLNLGGVEVCMLGPEDHLRLLCLHLLRHGASRPLWLCDVGAALESRSADFDWEYFLSGNRRRTDYVACTLGLAHWLLGARLDGTPVKGGDEQLPSWLVPTVLRQWGAGFRRRAPMGTYVRRPAGALKELRQHWPNAIEGTVGVGGPFNELSRLPFQIAHGLIRTARFAIELPRFI